MLENFNMMHLMWLFAAIGLEIGANILLKMSQGFRRWGIGIAAILCVIAAFTCLSFAVTGIELSVAYALWGSLGIIITMFVGIFLFGQRVNAKGWTGISILLVGMLLIKFA